MESLKEHYCALTLKKILLQFCKSQHNKKGKKRVICVTCNMFYIHFQLVTDSQHHQPCLQPLPSLATHCWENPAGREPRGEVPPKERGEGCSLVLHVPPSGLTRGGEKG